MHDRAHPDIWCVVRSYWAQADYDGRPPAVFCADLPAVFLDVWQSVFCQSDDHAGRAVQPAWRILRPDIDGIGRAISDSRALDRARHRLQHRGHAVWRLCTVLRDLADPSDRHADCTGILSDVRRGGWTASGPIPQGTSPRREVFGHGRRRTNCRLVLTKTSDETSALGRYY